MAKQGACARACRIMQMYVRLLETDENGNGYCCSCGKMVQWADAQGGHFIPKGRHYNGACLEEDNVHLQCATCNTYRQGNVGGYVQYMMREYGEDVIECLKQRSYEKIETEEFRETARIYKKKCKDLLKDKNFEVNLQKL